MRYFTSKCIARNMMHKDFKILDFKQNRCFAKIAYELETLKDVLFFVTLSSDDYHKNQLCIITVFVKKALNSCLFFLVNFTVVPRC